MNIISVITFDDVTIVSGSDVKGTILCLIQNGEHVAVANAKTNFESSPRTSEVCGVLIDERKEASSEKARRIRCSQANGYGMDQFSIRHNLFLFFLLALDDVLGRLLFTRRLEVFAPRDKKFLSIISAENLSKAARQRRMKKVFSSFLCSLTQKTITKLIRKTRARDYELTRIRVFSDRFVRL